MQWWVQCIKHLRYMWEIVIIKAMVLNNASWGQLMLLERENERLKKVNHQ